MRSLAVNAPAPQVLAALTAAPSSFGGSGTVSIVNAGPLLTIAAGIERLYVGLQPIDDGETMLHLIVGPSQTVRPHQVSLWAEALRWQIEADAASAVPT